MVSEESDIESFLTTKTDEILKEENEEDFEADSIFSNFENSIYSLEELDTIDLPRKNRRQYRKKNPFEDCDDKNPNPEPDVIEITHELQNISSKLKDENKLLHERKTEVKKREQILSVAQKNFQTIVDLQVKRKREIIEKSYKEELEKTLIQLKEKTKDYKRLKENFDTLKMANDSLRLEVESLTKERTKSEKQVSSLQARLTNLQRLQEQNQRQNLAIHNFEPKTTTNGTIPRPSGKNTKQSSERPTKKTAKMSKALQSMYDLLPILLTWLVDTQLASPLIESSSAIKISSRSSQISIASSDSCEKSDLISDRCLKIIPILVDFLRDFPSQAEQISLPCLQFIHWAIKYLEENNAQSKSALITTLRRLGEELYHSRGVVASISSKKENRNDDDGDNDDSSDSKLVKLAPFSSNAVDKKREGIYLKSPDIHVRLLSCFIILRTVTQVDFLAHVLDELKNELQSEVGKELFLFYRATPIVLQYMKPIHKALVSNSIDVFLPMSMESVFLQPFLVTCSNERWFRTVALVLRTTSLDNKVFEKLSIILQKLSKIKNNKKLFDIYSIANLIQDLSRLMTSSGNQDHSFLDLNLRSILFNLGIPAIHSDQS